ncbi:DNA-binding transcriptional regulator, GntR family [Raineyella antarctica]|uniref:DNA-binding transcriptional regulator, GntR family n=1 Tax=Raineyella antarctica TaxID=1577474 RepID=A0A1G6GEN1_9ACTN|nr:GntR family transcriptional regulator [Raineyella antarctica]SDB80359.1 DNA-binding transcriptional regulator, GntR family [Raineyella antarctica]
MFPPAGRGSAIGGRLARQVYEQLKADLLAGRYSAGEAITVVKLREEYQVSKQPVMEALHTLAADRLVEIQPQVGVRVSSFSPEDVATFFWIFARTEGGMAYRAALTRTDAQLAELDQLCDSIDALPGATDDSGRSAHVPQNRAIHTLIHRMSAAPLAADISQRLWDLSDFMIATHGSGFSGHLAERNRGHREVLDAIRRRDAEGAEAAMTRHILDSPLAMPAGSPAVPPGSYDTAR